jgi:hypothetical protein
VTHEQFANLVFTDGIRAKLCEYDNDFKTIIISAVFNLHEEGELTPPPAICNSIEGARYRDMLSRYTSPTVCPQPLSDALSIFFAELPLPTGTDLTIPAADHFADVRKTAERMILPFYSEECRTSGAFQSLRNQLDRNLEAVKFVTPTEYKGDDPVFTYLHDTPLMQLFAVQVPFGIPDIARFEGQWIVAPQGAGKTQFIQYQISKLLNDNASIIVIDSQEEMIRTLSHIKAIKDRLILIDANDVEFPLALNIFDLGQADNLPPIEQERRLNTALEVVGFLLDSLLGSDLTSKQQVVFRFITQALLAIPNATILTFQELLQNGTWQYQKYIDTLEGAAQSFFAEQFNSDQFKSTRQEIARRLYGILGIRAWERMFTQPKTKLDLFAEMNAGKIILINTARSLLQSKGCEAFGRFFLALITMAAQRRATLSYKLPVHVFIDEVYDYLPNTSDSNVLTIIEQCRKQKIALTVAHQNCSQLSQRTLDTLQTVAIKCVSSLTSRDAGIMAGGMRGKPHDLQDQPRGTFACYVRNVTPKPVNLNVPFGVLEDMERMSDEEYDALTTAMRGRYTVSRLRYPPEEASDAVFSDDHGASISRDPRPSTPGTEEKTRFATDIDILGD